MRRLVLVPVLAAALVVASASTAWAGSPHFIQNATTVSRSADTLTVSGKEAGLGDEAQIHVVLTATAVCINGGGNHPKAANKESVSAQGDFPVQNGKADWTLSVTAVFQPSCSPPMTVAFTDVTVTDTTNGLTLNIPVTF
jgi:hypothetical protein